VADLNTAAENIIAANHAPRDSRGRGTRGSTPPQPTTSPANRQ
jgi:hypothetical protein